MKTLLVQNRSPNAGGTKPKPKPEIRYYLYRSLKLRPELPRGLKNQVLKALSVSAGLNLEADLIQTTFDTILRIDFTVSASA